MRQEKDNNKNPIYLTKKLDRFKNCLQGIAAIICNLCAVKYEGNRCTEGYFKDCLPNSLKAITECTILRHQVIHWFWLKIKPNHMQFKDFFNEWVQILTYVKKEYLHRWMDLPIEAKLCKEVFLAQPKAYQPYKLKCIGWSKKTSSSSKSPQRATTMPMYVVVKTRGSQMPKKRSRNTANQERKNAKFKTNLELVNHWDPRDRDRHQYHHFMWPYEHCEDCTCDQDLLYQEYRDRDCYYNDWLQSLDNHHYAKAKDQSKDCKRNHQAHYLDVSNRQLSHSQSMSSSDKEIKNIASTSPKQYCSCSSSSSKHNEHLLMSNKWRLTISASGTENPWLSALSRPRAP